MTSQLDLASLRPEASLNRTVIPNRAPFPSELRNATAIDLLGSPAMNALLECPDPIARAAERLAAIIAALVVSGDRAAGSAWRRAYLRHWRTVDRLWLAGGYAARLGAAIGPSVTHRLKHYGLTIGVDLLPHPAVSALIGLARTTITVRSETLVFDIGQTLVKRGVATFAPDGSVATLRVRPPVAVDERSTRAQQDEHILRVIDAARAIESTTSVRCAIAAYIGPDGAACDGTTAYAPLIRRLADRGIPVVHDGTASSTALDPAPHAAVITLGTALGVGLDTNAPRRAMSPAFSVIESSRVDI